TTIHGGTGSTVHVMATRHFSVGGQGTDVRLMPSGNGLNLEASTSRGRFPFGESSWVEYAVDVPSSVAVKASTSSGALEIDGVDGAVDAQSSSGAIVGNNLKHLNEASSSSGSITLSGVFTEAAHVSASIV